MKNIEIIYSKGHLIDKESGNRIHLRPVYSYFIQGDNDAFGESDSLNQPPDIILISQQLQEAVKRAKEDKGFTYIFDCVLLEDLYLYQNANQKIKLFDCACMTTTCIEGKLLVFEKVFGKSLNQLFSNVVIFYLPLQQSGSIKAFSAFYLAKETNKFLLEEIRNEFHWELKAKELATEIEKSNRK